MIRRVVVTGIGAVTPIGNNVASYLHALQNGVSGAATITRFDASLFKAQFACEVKGFASEIAIDRKEARRIDVYAQYGIVAVDEALKMSGLEPDKLNLDRAGVIFGSGIGGMQTLEAEIADFARGSGTPRYNPFLIPKMISNIAAGLMAIKYGFRGINYATVSACASANHAIINAFDYIRLGKADVLITGGSEATVTATGVGGFTAMHAMSTRNADPTTASRPYDKERDGFVLGEGGAALILEEYEHAKARGANILCEIVGTGMSCDAYHMTAPDPEGKGVMNCMRMALAEAGLTPADVDYINTHGTSTPLGDIAEIRSIMGVFGEQAYKTNISSTKSMTGHLLGAAGAIEAVAGILGMLHDFVPPTINHFTDDPEIDARLNLTFNEAQQRRLNVVLSNGFGFGGHNTSVIFKRM
ncbi:MAG: beta-ketoacyl-ACP synthase II [Saprospiraceae bacterium]|nr:beta-ketoacyl-ACP synthase II [Saprospiraceae bacterium]